MKITKEQSEFGLNIFLEEDNNKYMGITFGGNGDLYWVGRNGNSFTITKENYALYRLFEQLFSDIENINIFDDEDFIEDKDRYRLYNHSNYNNLFNKENNTITWYSDETNELVANYLIITKEEESFKINFYIQEHIEGYDMDFHSKFYIPVRFRNSGSRYDPFNIVFMRMYNKMKDIDDVNDYGHQIHIEEYLYSKKLVKEK